MLVKGGETENKARKFLKVLVFSFYESVFIGFYMHITKKKKKIYMHILSKENMRFTCILVCVKRFASVYISKIQLYFFVLTFTSIVLNDLYHHFLYVLLELRKCYCFIHQQSPISNLTRSNQIFNACIFALILVQHFVSKEIFWSPKLACIMT